MKRKNSRLIIRPINEVVQTEKGTIFSCWQCFHDQVETV